MPPTLRPPPPTPLFESSQGPEARHVAELARLFGEVRRNDASLVFQSLRHRHLLACLYDRYAETLRVVMGDASVVRGRGVGNKSVAKDRILRDVTASAGEVSATRP